MNQAFGASISGSDFDFKAYITKPSVVIRIISLLFSIIVFGCIINGGYFQTNCMYHNDSNACNYGIGIGVIAFIACIAFLIGEFLFPRISNVDHRKYFVIVDMGFSGLWTFLWFVGFCYLTNRWNNSTLRAGLTYNDVKGAIAFSFFSIVSWGLQTFFAVRHYQEGVGDIFASSDDVLDKQQYSGNIPDPMGRSGGSSTYNDDQMIGGDLSGGTGYQQQQHY